MSGRGGRPRKRGQRYRNASERKAAMRARRLNAAAAVCQFRDADGLEDKTEDVLLIPAVKTEPQGIKQEYDDPDLPCNIKQEEEIASQSEIKLPEFCSIKTEFQDSGDDGLENKLDSGEMCKVECVDTYSKNEEIDESVSKMSPSQYLSVNIRKEIDKHRALLHGVEKNILICKICNETFIDKNKLYEHMNFHKEVRLYKCKICHKFYEKESHLVNHMYIHSGESPCVCEVCNKSFSEKRNLDLHMRTHNASHTYICDVCNKPFVVKVYMNKHKITHRVKPYICDICGRSFSEKNHLDTHMYLHAENDNFIVCFICNSSFTENDEFEQHMEKHSERQPHVCDLCKTLDTPSISEKRAANTDSNRELHYCKYCNKHFGYKHNLNRHLKTHVCEFCKKIFAEKEVLWQHIVSHHIESTFTCNECNETFIYKKDLEMHVLNHDGEMKSVLS